MQRFLIYKMVQLYRSAFSLAFVILVMAPFTVFGGPINHPISSLSKRYVQKFVSKKDLFILFIFTKDWRRNSITIYVRPHGSSLTNRVLDSFQMTALKFFAQVSVILRRVRTVDLTNFGSEQYHCSTLLLPLFDIFLYFETYFRSYSKKELLMKFTNGLIDYFSDKSLKSIARQNLPRTEEAVRKWIWLQLFEVLSNKLWSHKFFLVSISKYFKQCTRIKTTSKLLNFVFFSFSW